MRYPALCALCLFGPAAAADVIVDTYGPGGTITNNTYYLWNGVPTWTLKIGFPFTAGAGGGLTGLTASVYRASSPQAVAKFELYADDGGLPGALLGSWSVATVFANTSSQPYPPPPRLNLDGSVRVVQGQRYHFVVGEDGTSGSMYWFVGPVANAGTQVYQYVPGPWFAEPHNKTFGAFRLEATVGCYANCDGSTQAPILNVQDFSCFLNQFASGTTYANCDNSTAAPVLNVQDFSCFLNRFAAGCS